MTREQAKLEFERLCDGLDRTFPPEKAKTVLAYIQAIEKWPYERGRKAIQKAIETCEKWPTIGQLNRIERELGYVGVPNATAYLTEPERVPSAEEVERDAWAVYVHQRRFELTDDEYLRYVQNREFRAEKDRSWRQEWEKKRSNERRLVALGGRPPTVNDTRTYREARSHLEREETAHDA